MMTEKVSTLRYDFKNYVPVDTTNASMIVIEKKWKCKCFAL